jgi:hypothetical protein
LTFALQFLLCNFGRRPCHIDLPAKQQTAKGLTAARDKLMNGGRHESAAGPFTTGDGVLTVRNPDL